MDITELVTIPEAAQLLSLSRSALYKAMARGVLRPVPVGGRRMLLRASVMAYRAAGSKGQPLRKRVVAPGPTSGPAAAERERASPVSCRLSGIRDLIVSDRRQQGKGFCVVGARFGARGEFQGHVVLREEIGTEADALAVLAAMQQEG